MVIGVSGKLGSGKDTVGLIIQALTEENLVIEEIADIATGKLALPKSNWEIKKMAGKLKEIASILLGVPVEKFEDRAFKESYLPEKWDYILLETDMGGYQEMHAVESPMHLSLKHLSLKRDFDSIKPNRMTVREFLQRLGTDAMRHGLHPNTWANAFWEDYKPKSWKAIEGKPIGMYPDWIITDVRFPNEADSVLNHGGILIRVNRDGDTGNHPSETGLDNWKLWNYVIDNNGSIFDLIIKIEEILKLEEIL